MSQEQWDAFIGTLSRPWREVAQALMRRVSDLLNEERNERHEDVQRLDRRIDGLAEQDQSDRGADGARPG